MCPFDEDGLIFTAFKVNMHTSIWGFDKQFSLKKYKIAVITHSQAFSNICKLLKLICFLNFLVPDIKCIMTRAL